MQILLEYRYLLMVFMLTWKQTKLSIDTNRVYFQQVFLLYVFVGCNGGSKQYKASTLFYFYSFMALFIVNVFSSHT